MESKTGYIKTIEGIPFFSEDRYWGKSSREELEKALLDLEQKGWESFKTEHQKKFDVTFDENRADWRFVIPVTKNSTVLDAGAGMGRISIPMARVAGKVVALDQSFLRSKFIKLRAEKERLSNIEVYVGDLFDAKFPEKSFDVIVMNGLLEWIGATDKFTDPREAQLASLRLCKKLLKKDGHLYIGIENRFAAAYLRGIDHSGMRFTSYMPRFVANLYTKLRKGKKYDTYTYTKHGYEKLLRETGFTDLTFYLPYPGYNNPRIMIPHDNLHVLAYAIRSLMPPRGLRRKIAQLLAEWSITLRLYRFVFFSYGIVVRNHE